MPAELDSKSKNLTLEIVDDASRADEIASDWRSLALACSAQPFALPSAGLTWWRHLGKGSLHVVTIRNGAGELVGLSPTFQRDRGRTPVIGFLGLGLGAIGGLLIGPSKHDLAGMLFESLTNDPRRVLHLVEFEQRGRGLEALRHQETFAVDARLQNECPTVDLGEVSDATSYLASPDRSNLRKNLAKAQRQLGDSEFTIAVARTIQEVASIRPAMDAIYDAAETANPRLHLGQGRYSAFFDELLDSLARDGDLTILVGSVDGEPAAFDVYVDSGNTAYAILGRINPAVSAFSPGHLLLKAGIDLAIERGHGRLDLQIGDDQYKLRWSNDSYDTVEVTAASPRRLPAAKMLLASLERAHRLSRLRS